jgi:hypothetical protein
VILEILIGVWAGALMASAVLMWRRTRRPGHRAAPVPDAAEDPYEPGLEWMLRRGAKLLPKKLRPALPQLEAAGLFVLGLVLLASVVPTGLRDEASEVWDASETGWLAAKNALSVAAIVTFGLVATALTLWLLIEGNVVQALFVAPVAIACGALGYFGIALLTGHSESAINMMETVGAALGAAILLGLLLLSALVTVLFLLSFAAGLATAVAERRVSPVLTPMLVLPFAALLAVMWLFVAESGVFDRPMDWFEGLVS